MAEGRDIFKAFGGLAGVGMGNSKGHFKYLCDSKCYPFKIKLVLS